MYLVYDQTKTQLKSSGEHHLAPIFLLNYLQYSNTVESHLFIKITSSLEQVLTIDDQQNTLSVHVCANTSIKSDSHFGDCLYHHMHHMIYIRPFYLYINWTDKYTANYNTTYYIGLIYIGNAYMQCILVPKA